PPERRRRAGADRVGEPRQAAPGAGQRRQAPRVEHLRDSVARQVRGLEARFRAPERAHRPQPGPDRKVRDRLGGLDRDPAVRGVEAEPHPPRGAARRRRQVAGERDAGAGRGEPEGAGGEPAEGARDGDAGEPCRGRSPARGLARARGEGGERAQRAGERGEPGRRARGGGRRERQAGGAAAERREAPAQRAVHPQRRAAAYGWSRAFSASSVAGPMPSISSSWSMDATPPCWSRKSMIFWAVIGPIPSIVSRSSTVAVPRLIGPEPAAPAAAPPSGAPAGASAGTTTCWPSASIAARLIASSSAFGVAPPARSTASVTREPAGRR